MSRTGSRPSAAVKGPSPGVSSTPNGEAFTSSSSGVALRVVPNARKTEVLGLHGEAIKLKVASPALEGKANAAILEFISATAGVPGRAAVLVSGAKSRDKVVRVEGMTAQELRNRLLGVRGSGG